MSIENLAGLQQEKTIPKQNTIRVLALDDSTTTSGYAIFDGIELVHYGALTLTQQDPIQRIIMFKNWMLDMIKEWEPDIVGIEDIQLQTWPSRKPTRANGEVEYKPLQNVAMFKTLAWLQGALLVALEELGIQHVVVHTATWRSSHCFKSKTRVDQKREAQKKVLEWYDKRVTQDEADAICIGRHIVNKEVSINYMVSWGENG